MKQNLYTSALQYFEKGRAAASSITNVNTERKDKITEIFQQLIEKTSSVHQVDNGVLLKMESEVSSLSQENSSLIPANMKTFFKSMHAIAGDNAKLAAKAIEAQRESTRVNCLAHLGCLRR